MGAKLEPEPELYCDDSWFLVVVLVRQGPVSPLALTKTLASPREDGLLA